MVIDLVRGWLRKRGFDIGRWAPELNHPFDVLPLLVRERLVHGTDFFVVQVGANDGVLDDPIRELILDHRLPGLLIEPLPDLFEKLKANYAGQSQLRFENIAVLPVEGPVTIHRVKADAPVAEHWHGIASFSRSNLQAQGVPDQFIVSQEVPGAPLAQILARHGVRSVGLLQVDTEGFDYEVIKSALSGGLRPDVVNYENCWLTPRTRYECKALLAQHGYRFVDVGKDTVAVLSPGARSSGRTASN